MADNRDDELAQDLKDALVLMHRALNVIADSMDDRGARSEVNNKATEMVRIIARLEYRHGLR